MGAVKQIISVVGARPNFMKVAPLHRAFAKYPDRFRHRIVHTGQHYDEKMSKVFFEDLEMPSPDFYLGIGSGTHAEQTARVMMEFEKVLDANRPDLVIVVGDVNSTMACSIVAVKKGIRVAHVEAGLRSFDRTMPEEINRLVTDSIADYLFVSEPSGMAHLKREGVSGEQVYFVGNVMIDSLVYYREKARRSGIHADLGLGSDPYTLVTLHRPSNVDSRERLGEILDLFSELLPQTRIVFPIHPRTRKMIADFGYGARVESMRGLSVTDPIGYIDFLALMERARLIVTDSGGIQEETTFLGIPCITLRLNTERPVTVDVGTNVLCGDDLGKALELSRQRLAGTLKTGRIPELWDGATAERIVNILAGIL